MSQQVNLHNHSHYSFLDGLSRAHEMVERVQALGQEYLALTDHGECGGHMEVARLCKKAGIGFLPGMEGYWLAPEKVAWHRAQKERKDKYPSPNHITLLAINNTGLANIWKLSSEAYTEKYHYYKPIASPELLRQYSEGVYASDGCLMTEFASAIMAGNEDIARQQLGTLLDIYRERFFMELHTWQFINDDHTLRKFEGEMLSTRDINARMTAVNQAKVALATEMGIPLVVVNDSHHARPDQWENKELVWAMNTSNDSDKKFAETLEKAAPKADHIMGDDELFHYMRRHGIADDVVAEAIKNSHAIASQVEVEVLTSTMSMPRVGTTEADDLEMLIDACEKGFQRYVTDQGLDEQRYYQRMEEELTLITDKHFAGYFNVVRDCVMAFRSGSWAQYVRAGSAKDPLLLGPGRGSVGGSLVAYLCGIDIIDPIKYGTSFSRFLSPGRKGLPDIDIDVPQSQRPEVLAYLRKRYGEENVCAIGTFSRNGVKGTLKDVGRALGIKLSELEPMSEHITQLEKLKDPEDPDEEDLTWDELLERKGGVLRPYQVKYPQLFSKMEEMTGLIRHSGVHASGVLISADPILGRIPLRWTKGKKPVVATQFDMNDVEALGGVKFDWLGLRHLDTLSRARKLIYERHGVWIDYDRTGLSVPEGCTNVLTFTDDLFDDPNIWPQIERGETLGIFQVETPNCTEAAIAFKPTSHADLANLTSIIRPGVADAGLKDVFMQRRAGERPVVYDHPLMERFVGPGWSTDTYGVLVYQEQIIECVEELAGFTKDESDDLRKAVGKKLMDKLMPMKAKFIDGCLGNLEFTSAVEKPAGVAERIWASIEASGRYAFNWSHAIEYGGYISGWEVWTKYHYPEEFIVALMATDTGNVNRYIREARRRDIDILPPDINRSDTKFTIEGNSIRYGIDTVFGVGLAASRDIQKGRPYSDLTDYLQRAGEGADKGVVYNLILIGAFNEMGAREEMLHQLERIRATDSLAQSTLDNPEKLEATITRRLANNPEQYAIKVPDFTDRDVMYEIEKKLVGTYVTVDPMERYLDILEQMVIRDPIDVVRYTKGQRFYIGGQVSAVRPTVTKKGKTPGASMAHLVVSWNEADFRIVAFPEAYASCHSLLKVGAPVVCQVKRLESGCALETLERLDLIYQQAGVA